MYIIVQMFVIVRFFLKEFKLLLSKDALHWLYVAVKMFKMLQKIPISNKYSYFQLSVNQIIINASWFDVM